MKAPIFKPFLNRCIASITILSVMLLFTNPVTTNASVSGARARADQICRVLRERGWQVRTNFTSGTLALGQSAFIRCTFYEGNTYKLVAGGCEDANDVDIAVYDENGNFIDSDQDASSLAVADFTPKWTGTFTVKVTMYDSTPDGAHFVLQYAFRKID